MAQNRVLHRCKSAWSPKWRMLHRPRVSAIISKPKTFINCLGFERGLWQRYKRRFAQVPKTRVFGAAPPPPLFYMFPICITSV